MPQPLDQQLQQFKFNQTLKFLMNLDPAWLHQQIINRQGIMPDTMFRPGKYPMPKEPPMKWFQGGKGVDYGIDQNMPDLHPRLLLEERDAIPGEPLLPFPPGQEPEAAAPDINQALLSTLSTKQREAYTLASRGLNQTQIGRELGISQVAARKRLLNAQRNLPQEAPTEDVVA